MKTFDHQQLKKKSKNTDMSRFTKKHFEAKSNYGKQQKDRKHRAKTQQLFLAEQPKWEQKWNRVEFRILGTTCNTYCVTIDSEEIHSTGIKGFKCTCPDFRRYQRWCKHIWFTLYKILGFSETDDVSLHSHIYSKACSHAQNGFRPVYPYLFFVWFLFQIFFFLLLFVLYISDVFFFLFSRVMLQIKPWVNEPCAICCENMEKNNRIKTCVRSCGQSVHGECYDRWTQRSHTCVYCRALDSYKEIERESVSVLPHLTNMNNPESVPVSLSLVCNTTVDKPEPTSETRIVTVSHSESVKMDYEKKNNSMANEKETKI